jgi:hypothetical protein
MDITVSPDIKQMVNTIRNKTQEKYVSRRSKSIAVNNLLTVVNDRRSPGTAAIIPGLPFNDMTFNNKQTQ